MRFTNLIKCNTNYYARNTNNKRLQNELDNNNIVNSIESKGNKVLNKDSKLDTAINNYARCIHLMKGIGNNYIRNANYES